MPRARGRQDGDCRCVAVAPSVCVKGKTKLTSRAARIKPMVDPVDIACVDADSAFKFVLGPVESGDIDVAMVDGEFRIFDIALCV